VDEGSPRLSVPKDYAITGIHTVRDLEDHSNQEHGIRQENYINVGVQIVGGEVQAREDGCGEAVNLNLNSNSNPVTPRHLGQSRDSQVEAGRIMDRLDGNREGWVGGVKEARAEGELEKSQSILVAEVERVVGGSG